VLQAKRWQDQLDQGAWIMLAIHGSYTAANLLAATFLSIFLWRTRQDLSLVAIFTGAWALVAPLAFISTGILFPRWGAGGSIRLGLLALGLFNFIILALGARSADWVVPLGLLRGAGDGLYWAGYHLVSYDATSERDRDRFFGFLGASTAFLAATVPALSGLLIVTGASAGTPYRGYQAVFGIACLFLLVAMLLAGRLQCGYLTVFSLRRMLRLARRNPAWRFVARARLVDGLSGFMGGMVTSVLIYLVLRNEQGVGNFNALLSVLTVVMSLGLGTWVRPNQRLTCALVGATLLVVSAMILPLYLTLSALVAFGMLRAVGTPLHANALAPLSLQVIDQDPQAKAHRYEYIVSSELWLAAGRVASVGCFLAMAVALDQVTLARVALVTAGAAPALTWALFARIPRVRPALAAAAAAAAA